MPLLKPNLNNGCPNMIDQYSGQAHKPFPRRFHSRSFLADVQTWELKLKFVFSATNLPHCQNLKTQRIKIITSMCQITLRDSSDHFYPPTGHVRPWDFVQPWDLAKKKRYRSVPPWEGSHLDFTTDFPNCSCNWLFRKTFLNDIRMLVFSLSPSKLKCPPMRTMLLRKRYRF